MIANSFEIDDSLHLTQVDSGSVVSACRDADARVWLDLQDFSDEELEGWLDSLGISGLTRQLCLDARDRPGFYPLNTEICFVMPVLADTKDRDEVNYVALVCRENLLLTVHHGPFLARQRIDELQDSESWLAERSIASLVAALMIDLSLACLQHTTALRKAIVSLDERMDRDADAVTVNEILEVRSRVLALGMVATDQLPSLQALCTTDKSFFRREDAHEYLNCALVNLGVASRILERADTSIGDLRSRLDMHAQDKTNRRLGMLTILSAIFMPATLMAGIWGMNFQIMPELGIAYGYPIALGAMALVGTGMYLFFRRRGWFG